MSARQQIGGYMKDDTRLALLEQSIGHINETMMRIERNVNNGFEKMDKRFDHVEKRFEKVEQDIKDVRALSWSHFRWIMGTVIALFATLATIFLKGHLT